MTLYETIFARRSVRKYDMTPLDSGVLDDLRGFLDATKRMDGQTVRFEIVGADKVKNAIAPHSILAYCTANDSAYANVGYVLQNADLYMQSNGYGCCWQGMAKPNEAEEEYCIMLAFGKTDVPMRSGAEDFKRLPIGEMCNADNGVMQAARLAPSAMNSQPWKVDFGEGKVRIGYIGRGVSKLILGKKLSKIDLGIVSRHIEVAVASEGKAIERVTPARIGKDFVIEVIYS